MNHNVSGFCFILPNLISQLHCGMPNKV